MFNSTSDQSKNTEYRSLNCSQLIATGIIVHDSKRARAAWMRHLWQYFMHYLLHGHEPRIRKQYRSCGRPIWHIYEPQTGRSAYCETEAEVIDWFEQRMNRW